MAKNPKQGMSPEGIAAFVYLLRPKTGEPGKEPKFQVVLVYDEDADLSVLEASIDAAGKERFKDDWPQVRKAMQRKDKWPIKNTDDVTNYGPPFDSTPGGRFVSFATTDKPGVVDEDAEDIISARDLYPGMIMRVTYNAHAYEHEEGGKGVTLYLRNAQKTGDGERLEVGATSTTAAEDFGSGKSKGKAKPRRDEDDDEDMPPRRKAKPRRDEDDDY